ncbi:hypothetical protein K431DRAFT_93240 [Polychaeton citri CBS 116435]|uniref:Uncharacterized protein n=1 Tax=Polychaeton citri CBS 116435 TaxID=1314669 RepID=A0A9P4Q4D9_9PEZI|nr:hypothetical protein K431DRAFT_93240 [Polychaeton citri CBS 116435]
MRVGDAILSLSPLLSSSSGLVAVEVPIVLSSVLRYSVVWYGRAGWQGGSVVVRWCSSVVGQQDGTGRNNSIGQHRKRYRPAQDGTWWEKCGAVRCVASRLLCSAPQAAAEAEMLLPADSASAGRVSFAPVGHVQLDWGLALGAVGGQPAHHTHTTHHTPPLASDPPACRSLPPFHTETSPWSADDNQHQRPRNSLQMHISARD